MIAIDDFQELQRRVARLREERDRARGQMDAIAARWADEFGVADLAAAEDLYARLRRQEDRTGRQYAEEKAAFEAEYKDLLGDA